MLRAGVYPTLDRQAEDGERDEQDGADRRERQRVGGKSHRDLEWPAGALWVSRLSMDRKDTPLFRQLAVEAAAGSQIGEPLRMHWRGVTVFTACAFALVVALLAFVSIAEYSPIHRVVAFTDAPGGLVRLRSPADGLVVTRIAAQEGAVVRQGDVLGVLGGDRLRTDGSSQRAAQQRKLEDEQAMIGREIEAARQEAAAQHALIDRRLAGLRVESASLRADLQFGELLLASLSTQSEQVSAVAEQGYATRQQAAQRRDEVTAQASRLANSRAALARVERDTEVAQSERRLVDARLAGLVENRRRSGGELERLMLTGDAEAERAIRAPQDGTVSAALIAEGQSVVLGQALFTLTPQGQPLVLRLLVPAREVASVRPGQDVKFVLRAYPQEKFGQFSARIDSVSDAPTLPTDLPQSGTVAEPVYVALARPAPLERGPGGQVLALKPGMLGEALIPVERRTIIEWLFEPVLRGFNESAARTPALRTP
jgi:membrane fusion protein